MSSFRHVSVEHSPTVKARPNEPCTCGSGKKYKKCCGRTSSAVRALSQAAPTRADLAHLTAHVNAGRHVELENAVRELLLRFPGTGFLWKVLGLALGAQGKDARATLERATELLPQDAEAHASLGNACRAVGRLDEAVASYRRALELRGDLAMARANLADALRVSGKLEEAAQSYAQTLALRPADAELHNRLASVLCDLGRLEEAEESSRRALTLKPNRAELHSNHAMVLMAGGRTVEAEQSCRRALELDPSLTAALVLLAELEAARGEFAAAESLIQRAIDVDPDMPDAWAALGRWRTGSRADHAWLAKVEQLVAGGLPPRREVRLRYALGKYFDDIGEFAQAFGHYRHANELTRSFNALYDRGEFTRQVDFLTGFHDRKWLAEAHSDTAGSSRAVFLVGMWRSGTTLAEQILASHPKVFGAGELPYWQAVAAKARGCTLRDIGSEYLSRLHRLSEGAERVVDKMSSNFLHLGAIHASLPNARIIHMRRDPRDTCLSIYFQDLLYGHRYASDLEDLAQYYRDYTRVMEHWRSLLPERTLLAVPYEGLVADPETWSRRMLDFIGLPWDERCLDFQHTPRTVMSSSKWQVRQALHQASVGRWRNYEPFLGPLRSLTTGSHPN